MLPLPTKLNIPAHLCLWPTWHVILPLPCSMILVGGGAYYFTERTSCPYGAHHSTAPRTSYLQHHRSSSPGRVPMWPKWFPTTRCSRRGLLTRVASTWLEALMRLYSVRRVMHDLWPFTTRLRSNRVLPRRAYASQRLWQQGTPWPMPFTQQPSQSLAPFQGWATQSSSSLFTLPC